MEEENAIKMKQGSYVSGIIGAIIGGLIATIPWILAYVYGGMMLSILATLIAAGEFYGYKLLKGRVNKVLPVILMILALVIVTVATLIIIPAALINKEGINVNSSNLQRLYENKEFAAAIMKDYVISVVFTILGASIVTSNIKKQLQNNNGENNEIKLDLSNTEETMKIKKANIELLKPIFTKYDAISKEKAMIKEEIENQDANQSFNYLKSLGIIKKYKGKYYYSEENESKQTKIKKMQPWQKVFLVIIMILFVITLIASLLDNSEKANKLYQDEKVSFEVSGDWNQGDSEYETEWNFFKYINTVPVLNSENTISEYDYSSYPAGINVYYDEVNAETLKSIEDVKANVQAGLESSENKPDSQDMEISKTEENYDLLKVRLVYKNYPTEILYYYYILGGDKLLCITSYSFNLDDEQDIEKETDKLVNTFKWL